MKEQGLVIVNASKGNAEPEPTKQTISKNVKSKGDEDNQSEVTIYHNAVEKESHGKRGSSSSEDIEMSQLNSSDENDNLHNLQILQNNVTNEKFNNTELYVTGAATAKMEVSHSICQPTMLE